MKFLKGMVFCVFLFVSMPVCACAPLRACVFLHVCVSICLVCVCVSFCLFVCVCFFLFVWLCVCLCLSLFLFCLFVCVCLNLYIFLCLSWTRLKFTRLLIRPGNTNWGRKFCTVDLLVKVASFVKNVNGIFNIKRSWSELVGTRRSIVLITHMRLYVLKVRPY